MVFHLQVARREQVSAWATQAYRLHYNKDFVLEMVMNVDVRLFAKLSGLPFRLSSRSSLLPVSLFFSQEEGKIRKKEISNQGIADGKRYFLPDYQKR